MSPEQALGKVVDKRSDIWAFGCVLYELLTGRRAFAGETATDTIAKVLEREPNWQPLPSSTPAEVRDLLRRCLDKDPNRRMGDMREVRGRVEKALAASHRWRPTRAQVLVMAGAALVVLLAVFFGLRPGGLRQGLPGPAARATIRSIAVLPLANYSGDAGQEYFADGMTDELTSDLAKLGALRVIARTSAMNYKGTHKSLKVIAKELGVDAVVEGSVLRAGQRVRIVAQLILGSTESHLWSETYERDVQDVLRLQSEVAQAIAREIKIVVTPEEKARLAAARTVKPEAYETYLKAMFFVNKFTPEGFEKGIAYLQQAVDKDPGDPFAYAALALGYGVVGHDRFPDALPRAKAAARRSLELGGEVPLAYLALAMAEIYSDWDYAAGARDLRRALELNPNLAEARRHYSWYLRLLGRNPESLAEMKRAASLEPLTPLFPADYGWQLLEDGQLDAALEQERKSLELDPKFAQALAIAGWIYVEKGMYPEALAAHQKAAAADEDWRFPLATTYARMGRKDDARKIAAALKKKPGPMDQWALAMIYAALGEKDEAFRWLEAAYKSRFSWMPWTVNDPKFGFAPLRDDPRFQDLARRVGVPR
jgi:TolB-like protein/Tfp pilus assembly protein PilF